VGLAFPFPLLLSPSTSAFSFLLTSTSTPFERSTLTACPLTVDGSSWQRWQAGLPSHILNLETAALPWLMQVLGCSPTAFHELRAACRQSREAPAGFQTLKRRGVTNGQCRQPACPPSSSASIQWTRVLANEQHSCDPTGLPCSRWEALELHPIPASALCLLSSAGQGDAGMPWLSPRLQCLIAAQSAGPSLSWAQCLWDMT